MFTDIYSGFKDHNIHFLSGSNGKTQHPDSCPEQSGQGTWVYPMEQQHIYTSEHLLEAYRRVRLGKRTKPATLLYDFWLERNVADLQHMLKNNIYKPFPYKYFIVTDPKKRHIAAPHFRDRIVHRALVNIIEPMLDKQFIHDSYACRKGKGTHYGLARVKRFLMAARCIYGKDTPLYFLKCDIEKYFASISWDILLSILRKKITDPYLFRLTETIITSHKVYKTNGATHILPEQVVSVLNRRGIPIGNLTSQLFANTYLNELDQYIKHTLKERWYARYMDDFLIIHPDKQHLKELRDAIRVFLRERLHLNLHPKKVSIQNVSHGVVFVGYRIFYDHILVRSKTIQRFQRRLAKRKKSAEAGLITKAKLQLMRESFIGHMKHAQTWNLKQSICPSDNKNLLKKERILSIFQKYYIQKAVYVPEKSDINRVTVPLVVKMSTDTDPLDILNLVTELQYLLGKKVIIIEHSQMSAEMRENMIVEGKVIC